MVPGLVSYTAELEATLELNGGPVLADGDWLARVTVCCCAFFPSDVDSSIFHLGPLCAQVRQAIALFFFSLVGRRSPRPCLLSNLHRAAAERLASPTSR